MKKKKISAEILSGNIIRKFSSDEALELSCEWLKVYGTGWKNFNNKSFLWHVFSYELYPSLSGKAAIEAYLQQASSEYIVLSNDCDLAIATDSLPEKCSLSDYYVFPSNFAWTMAFTHEDGWLGPYFARHSEFEKLNESNIKKSREIERARKNGWL